MARNKEQEDFTEFLVTKVGRAYTAYIVAGKYAFVKFVGDSTSREFRLKNGEWIPYND